MRLHIRPVGTIALGLAGALLAARCGSSTATSTAPTEIPRCGITLNNSQMNLPASGGSGAVSVTATRECAWSATVEGNWLTLKNGASGQGEGTVEFAAAANPDPQARTGAIIVNNSRAQISQAAGECLISLSSPSAEFSSAGGTTRIDVQASSQLCTWTASSDSAWIQITSSAAGRGSGPVTISVAATTGPPRTGSVTIAGQQFSVTQSQGCIYAIDRTAHNAPAGGGSATVAIATAAGCPWTAASNVPWIGVKPQAGAGPGTVTFSVASTSGPERTGTAVIAGQLLTVAQAPGCTFHVEPAAHTIGAAGGSLSVSVNTAANCAWTAASNADWIAVQGSATGSGAGHVTFSVASTSGPARTGAVTVAGRQVAVSQAQGCTYSISPERESIAPTGGTGKVAVATAAACAWTATSNASWITITSGASGSGNGDVQYSAAATGGPARSATITIAGRTFTVSQGEGCSFRLSPVSLDVGSEGGQRSFEVQTASGCAWTASTTTSWITIDSGANGSGNGTVRFTVAANAGPGRTGTITAGGQTFTINQGTGCTVSLSADRHDAPPEGGAGSVNVMAGDACAWTAASHASWITIAAGATGSGNGSVAFTVAANTGAARSGTLTIAGRTFTVDQASGCTYAVAPASIAAPAAGTAARIEVTTAAGCAWTAAPSAEWITFTSASSGSGNGAVDVAIASSSGPSRSGTVAIGGAIVTVTQESGCTITIAPTAQPIPAAGGSGVVTITAGAGCPWTAVSSASWIVVIAGASGTGNGAVQFTVEANATGAARSGTIAIGGQTFTVNQQ